MPQYRAGTRPATPPARASGGYSLVELVLVIVILAIIGSVAGPRFFDNDAFNERAYYDELVSAIRYAQKIAVASGCRVRIDIGVSSYNLTQQQAQAGHCNPADLAYPVPVLLSTGEVVTGNAPAGILTAPAQAFEFTGLGQTTLAADRVFTVGGRTLTVIAGSGLVVTP